jgi:hypothetical protein
MPIVNPRQDGDSAGVFDELTTCGPAVGPRNGLFDDAEPPSFQQRFGFIGHRLNCRRRRLIAAIVSPPKPLAARAESSQTFAEFAPGW